MTDAEVLLTLASAQIAVFLSLFVALVLWIFRRSLRRALNEIHVIGQAFRLRTRQAIVDGIGAVGVLSGLCALLLVAPIILTVAPMLLAIAGLELTVHMVKVGH
jgi:hypothetical protein